MRFSANLLYVLTPYADADERAVGRFFKSLTERSSQSKTRAKLGSLLQHNIAVINLWTEYRYKGYRYLRKSERKKLYTNLQVIVNDFDEFYTRNARSAGEVTTRIQRHAPQTIIDPEKAVLLQAIMDYFSPARGVYQYRDSSSFGRLLRNPAHEKLTGDCNQIVTLYIYIYSQYYEVRDLRIRALPEHVALHYNGVDIEATSGTFANYNGREGGALLPIEEIVSINLLDTTDAYLSTHEVAAEDFLQASRLAFMVSHERDIASQNLKAAYGRLVNSLMERNNYSQALQIAKASRDQLLLNVVGHNGAVYEMKRHNYASARRFAASSLKHDELIRDSWRTEGVYHYQAHRYHDAIRAFKHTDDQALVRQSYEALFFEEQARLGSSVTRESIKKHTKTIKRMRAYAKKSGNKKLIQHTDSLNKLL